MRLSPIALAAVSAVALLAAGCGSKTISDDDLEEKLAELLAPQAGENP